MNYKNIVVGINRRFAPIFGWPEDFIQAIEIENDGFILRIGWSDVQFDRDGTCVGGGTDLTGRWKVKISDGNIKKCCLNNHQCALTREASWQW